MALKKSMQGAPTSIRVVDEKINVSLPFLTSNDSAEIESRLLVYKLKNGKEAREAPTYKRVLESPYLRSAKPHQNESS
jgi:hypothetical protein